MKEKLQIPKILCARLRGGYAQFDAGVSDKAENKIVETEQFVEVPFRILSKSYIESHDLDLTKGDVLKNAVSLFKTRVLKDHTISLESIIGHVMESSWSESAGKIPAGVDGTYRIFKKFSGDIPDKLMTSPPLINSTSAGIMYEWEKSHPDMEGFDFYMNLGRNVDGEIVRFIVKEIVSIFEVSLVYLGADNFAKRLESPLPPLQKGAIHFPLENGDSYKGTLLNSGEALEQAKHYFSTMQKQILFIEDNMKLTKIQADSLGMKTVEVMKLGLDKAESVDVDQPFLDNLVARLTVLESEKKQFEGKLQASEKLASLGREYETSLRDEATKNYRALGPESVDEKILELIQSVDLAQVQSLNKEYLKRLELLHPKKDSRQSSVDENTETEIAKTSNSEVEDYKVR